MWLHGLYSATAIQATLLLGKPAGVCAAQNTIPECDTRNLQATLSL